MSTAVLTALKRSINRSAGADTMRLSFLPVSEVSYTTRKASARDSRTVQSKNIITMRFLPSFLAATDAKPVTATNLAKLGQASHFAQKVRRAAGKQGKWPGESKAGGRMGGGSVRGGSVRSAGSVGSRSSRGSRVSQASHAEQTFDVVDRVKDVILSRGGAHGIRGLSRVLKIMDDSGDKQLTKDELYYGLRDYGVDLTPREMKVIMTYFDRDKSGTVSFDEFLRGIRGDMNPRRLALVNQAFDVLDKTGDGEVTVEDLRDVYSVEKHPGVLEGKLTPDQALAEFLDQWDTVDKDGIVTREEFAEYYAGISASIDDDDYFELMIRNAWHISGGEGWCANTTCRRVFVTHRDGHTSVEEITDDLGVDGDDKEAMIESLASRGIDAVNVEIHGQAGDTGKGGVKGRRPAGAGRRQSGGSRGSRRSDDPFSGVGGGGGDQDVPPNLLPPAGVSNSCLRPVENKSVRSEGWPRLRQLLFSPPLDVTGLLQRLAQGQIGTGLMPCKAFEAQLIRLDKRLQRRDAAGLTRLASDPDDRRSSRPATHVDVPRLHASFVERFGMRSKDGSRPKVNTTRAAPRKGPPPVIARVRAKILERGGKNGIRSLRRVLMIMDDSGDLNLTADEFKYGMRDYGVELSTREIEDCMVYFDRDKSGTISFDEFLGGIRGDMNPRRLALVNQAFDILDKTGDGEVTVEDIEGVYSVEKHVGVLQGKVTPEEALAEFLDQWDTVDKDGIVTREEFAEYYAGISASIDDDDYFELMIRNAWHISGGEGWCANTTCRRVFVTHRDGHTSVEEITDDLGVNADDEKAIMASLASRGIRAVKVEIHGQAGGAAGKPKRKPPVGVASMFGGGGAPAKAPTRDPHAPHRGMQERDLDASERKQAAQSVQAAFRGLKGRREGERAQRKGVR